MTRSAIILVIDRLGTNCLGPYGNTWAETPNFNALAARGMLLENLIADSPDLTSAYRAYFAGRHASDPAGTKDDAEAIRRIADAGVMTSLITDDPRVAELPATEALQEKLLLNLDSPAVCADAFEETALAKLFAAAVDALQRQDSPFLLWVHARGLGGPWDAPLALRQSLAAEDDPEAWAGVDVPSLRLAADYDPDELLPIMQAYAAQVMLLDICLGVLMDAVDQHPRQDDLLTIVTSPRGFPLGEHLLVGDCQTELYGELLHVPGILCRGDGQAAPARSHALAQPPDIAATLMDWFSIEAAAPTAPSLLSLAQSAAAWPRDRALSAYGEQRAIRTPAWFYRRLPWNESVPPGETPCELFRKPDDRYEVNEISRRCPRIVEQLNAVMDDGDLPLSEELIEGID